MRTYELASHTLARVTLPVIYTVNTLARVCEGKWLYPVNIHANMLEKKGIAIWTKSLIFAESE